MTEGEKAGEVSVAEATRSDTGGSPGGSAGKSQSQALFDQKVSAGETKEAVRLLRAESELDISKDQAWRLLDSIPLDVSEENETEQQILVSLTYAALRKRELLTGFGVVPVSPEALPLASKEVDVAGLEATLGMGMAALTPKSSSMPWTVLGFGLFGAEFALAQQLGYDPMRTVVPVSALAFVLDRVVLSGAIFESVSRLLFPAYKRKVIQHEAGHFLLAYLLGCPIQGFFLSAWDASNAGIRGQAGTVFFDNDLSSQVCVSDCRACMYVCVCVHMHAPCFLTRELPSQLKANKVTRTAIDRYTIVLMAGIAAEAITYQQAEGGASDEAALVNFLVGLSPPWDQQRVFNQARWAVTQAALLLREHQSAYDELVEAMAAGASLGACISVIEGQLSQREELPVTARIRQRSAASTTTAPPSLASTAGGALAPAAPSGELSRLDAQIAAKQDELAAIQAREAELQAKIRELDSLANAAPAAPGGGGGGGGGGGAWDKSETQRFMDSLLRAQRSRKAKDAATGKRGAKQIDALLEAATRERRLAEVDLKLREKEAELAEIDAKLKEQGRQE